MSSRSRALALLGIATVCAGLAASIVSRYESDVRAQVGPLTPVLVARQPVPRGRLFTATNVPRLLASRRVPVQFVPPKSLRYASDAVGLRSLIPVPSGNYLSEGQLARPGSRGARSRSGFANSGRVVEVEVAGAAALESNLGPGSRVDVLITSERGADAPRTYLALQGIQLVDFRPGRAGDGSPGGAGESLASLRVTLRQAVLLTAAQNFARELRLVPRPVGEDRRLPPTAVSAQDLRP